jgi:hypothetical protein
VNHFTFSDSFPDTVNTIMTLDDGTPPWDGGTYFISPFNSNNAVTRVDLQRDVVLMDLDKALTAQQWLCEDSNGFFLFSAMETAGGSPGYLAVDGGNHLWTVSSASQAARFVARLDPKGGFELLVFTMSDTSSSGTTGTSTPELQPVDKDAVLLKVVTTQSTLRVAFSST